MVWVKGHSVQSDASTSAELTGPDAAAKLYGSPTGDSKTPTDYTPDPAQAAAQGYGANNQFFKYWTGNSAREKRVVDFIVDTRNQIKSSRFMREQVWLECYNIYRQVHQHQQYQGRANLYLPSGFSAVETIAPRLILGLLGQSPFIKLQPRKNATADRALKVSKLLQLQADQAEFFWAFASFIKQMCIYGRGRGKTWWDRRFKQVMRKGLIPGVRQGPQGPEAYATFGGVPQNELVFDGPRFRTVDPFRLFEDDTAMSIDESALQIERVIKREYALQQGAKQGYYGNLADIDSMKQTGQALYSPEEVQRALATGIKVDGLYDTEPKYDVSEFWGLFDIDEDGTKEECKITVLGDKRVICIEENPFWHNSRPYIDCPYIPVDQELDGIGILEPIRSLVYELNDTHNQVLDNKTLMLNCMWLMDENANIRVSDLKSRPGGVVRTRSMTGLEAMRPPDFTSAGYNAFNLMERLVKEASGATNPLMGASSSGDQTATEVTSLINEGNVRMRLCTRLLEVRALVRIFKQWYSMDEQMMNRTTYMQVIEDGAPLDLEVTPDDIYGDYDFEPQGALQMHNEQVKNQQKIAFFNIAAKYAPQTIPFLLSQIWKDMDQRGGEALEKMFAAYPGMTTGLAPATPTPGPMPEPSAMVTPGQIMSNTPQPGVKP